MSQTAFKSPRGAYKNIVDNKTPTPITTLLFSLPFFVQPRLEMSPVFKKFSMCFSYNGRKVFPLFDHLRIWEGKFIGRLWRTRSCVGFVTVKGGKGTERSWNGFRLAGATFLPVLKLITATGRKQSQNV